jgi:hypothetical protein
VGSANGGSELGVGVILQDLVSFSPKAGDCGCPCHGGVAAATAADFLVVSNWGATGIIAALAAIHEDPVTLPEPELEARSIEACAAAGGVGGAFEGAELAVDPSSMASRPPRRWRYTSRTPTS